MTFHADLWVATATAAPVVALSATVSISENIRQFLRMTTALSGELTARVISVNLTLASLFLNFINILMQMFILLFSLLSLSRYHNMVGPTAIIICTFLGLTLIAIVTPLSGAAAYRLRSMKLGDEQETDDSSRHLGTTSQHAASIPEQIAQLAALRDQGILTDEEFAAKKSSLLSQI